MKNGEKWRWVEVSSGIVALAALVLFVITLLTTPFAMSKYYASGSGSASAHIAKFAPSVTLGSGWPATSAKKSVLFNNAIGKTNAWNATFTVNNGGETMIKATPKLVNTANNAVLSGVTFNPTSADIAVGGSQSFSMAVAYESSGAAGSETTAELRVDIVQVD
ncbi:MAG: DUF3379 domain-containing protein [Oscillospiraceae bacterium]|jgi:hypothetical protein|nr:DUF3379 domain-containing protein [Oscillospiraceae bacterium]